VDAGEDLNTFAQKLAGVDIEQSVSDDTWSLSAKPEGVEIAADTPLTPEKREQTRLEHTIPITEPFLECPGISVVPNEWFAK